MRDGKDLSIRIHRTEDVAAEEFYWNASGNRINTDAFMLNILRGIYPGAYIAVTTESSGSLLGYAAAGYAEAALVDGEDGAGPSTLMWREYEPPLTRLNGDTGSLAIKVHYAKYAYKWKSHSFIVYYISGRDGSSSWPDTRNFYIIGETKPADELIMAVGQWNQELHDEVWVFKQGNWWRDADLWKSIQKASWANVILDADMKNALITDVDRFFDSRKVYQEYGVPWKRGVIYHGPPGNGKTISIKAMMHSLSKRNPPIPTLYVRSLQR
jgi:transitional endoplasmic reticulum ATPase